MAERLVTCDEPPETLVTCDEPPKTLVTCDEPPDTLVTCDEPPETLVTCDEPPETLVTGDEPPDTLVTCDEPPETLVTCDEPPDTLVTCDEPPETLVTGDEPPETLVTCDEPPDTLVNCEEPPDTLVTCDEPPKELVTHKGPPGEQRRKVLPELTTCNSVYGLAILSTCDYRTLQSESHDTLENLVFQGKTSALHLDDLQLKQCLEMLIDYFKHICYPQKEDPSLFVLIQRKYLLLVMLLGEVISRCQDVTDYGRCEDINKKLMLLVSQQTENKTKLEVLGKLQKCFKLSPRDLENIAKLTSDHRPQNSSKKIWKYDDQMHFFLILQQLKQLFQTAEIKILTVLEKWLTKSKRFLRQRSRCSYLCVQLVQRGLAHFLQYMAKDLDHMNLNELCPVVLKVLERFQSEDQRTFQDVVHSVQHLLVCPVKVIRDSVHSLLRLTSEHHAEKLSELVIIIEKILFPLFVINNVIHQIKSNSKEDWIKMSGAFNGFPVYLYIRNPKFVNRLERNKMEFLSEGDLNILRHIRTLQALRHDSIVKLYSYSLYELPQFYIIEQSTIEMCRDLQMYLLNKGSNESFCTHLELFNMLIQAADALVYCHNNNYIHGNITLKHFILTSPGCIKLTDFHLATSLQDTETVNWDREQLQDLPTLYSAPETLRRKKRSKQSDVWMFGCFSNSVLNHGEMIPCDMKLTNKNILDKVLKMNLMGHIQNTPQLSLIRCRLKEKEFTKKKENFNLFRSKLKDVSPQLRESIKNGTLDHVVPFVRVVTKGYQKFTIEVRIPFQLSGNILTSIKTNQRGNPDATLNDLIIQVANIVKSLHESNIVLGEIKADQFFVEELPHGQHCKKKVHLTSFSYLAFASDNSQHNIQVDSASIRLFVVDKNDPKDLQILLSPPS
ncbi:hypothetical protein Btru_041143 [Bulinus truncatus]|nr:hypothetical protein Btru_041143 [Bulinus truncatus]